MTCLLSDRFLQHTLQTLARLRTILQTSSNLVPSLRNVPLFSSGSAVLTDDLDTYDLFGAWTMIPASPQTLRRFSDHTHDSGRPASNLSSKGSQSVTDDPSSVYSHSSKKLPTKQFLPLYSVSKSCLEKILYAPTNFY